MLVKDRKGFYVLEELLESGVRHGFSPASFGDMSYKYGIKEDVNRNRNLFADAVGFERTRVVQMSLDHSNKIAKVKDVDVGGLTSNIKYKAHTDGLVTDKKLVALWLLTGDCAPFIFYDGDKNIIGLAHVGFLGFLCDLPYLMARKLVRLGCKPEDIEVGIGPAIRKCCYGFPKSALSEEVKTKIPNYLVERDGMVFVDFVGHSIDRLKSLNLTKIYDSSYCVKHEGNFYSLRKEKEGGLVGRFATVVQMV